MAKKISKKKKIIIAVSVVLVVALIVAGVLVSQNYLNKQEVTLHTIATEDILETINATGAVTSGANVEYKVGTVATVKEVFVKVGDSVKKGDVLATFDTSNLDSQVESLQESYNDAVASYNEAVTAQKEAQKNLDDVNSQITKLQKEIAVLEKKADENEKANMSALNSLTTAIEKITNIISSYSSDYQQVSTVIDLVMKEINKATESDNIDIEKLAKNITNALQKGIDNGTINIKNADKMIAEIEKTINSVDIESANIDLETSTTLIDKQVEMISLTAQQQILSLTADESLLSTQEKLVETTKSALDTIKESRQQLANGWTASIDGVITECSLVPGAQTNLLTTGIKLENMDSMTATISLTEYDVHKVKVGMPATITTVYGSYEGEVATIAPVATGGSGSSLLDSVGSMAGISGLSSLTQSGAGVECTVTIFETDSNIIPGFDADIEIKIGEFNDVPCVPIESLVLEKTGAYVYKYNAEDSTVTKTMITTGAISDSSYQVTSGLDVGDQIVAVPSTMYEGDTFEVRVVDKLSTDKEQLV